MKLLLRLCWVLFNLTIVNRAVQGGLAYPDPPGGWTYTLKGDAADVGTAGTAFDALDGTWNFINGSSEWDGSVVGPAITTTNKPGGVTVVTNGQHVTEIGVSYLRIQDPGNPSQYGFAAPSNRKIFFGHDMTAEGCPNTVLDDGFTLSFRARIPTPARTTAPLDPLYPNGESGNGPQPYPADGDGYLIADNANGLISVRQLAIGKLGFSLVTSNDTLGGLNSAPKAGFQGLQLNGLNGIAPTNTIDFGEVPPQYLPLDPTEWNEFWIVIRKDDAGLGTHVVVVYTNGSTAAQIFHVTAASAGGEYPSVSQAGLGMSQTAQMGAVDLDFLSYKFESVFPPGATSIPNPRLVNPTVIGANFQFSCATVLNRTYFVEFKDSLNNATWQFQQPGIAGDGSVKSFSAPVGAAASRFYRIRVE